VYDPAFLTVTASGFGIPRGRVEDLLTGSEFADAVWQDEAQARQLGITGVPFAVFGDRLAIPGAASIDGYLKAKAVKLGVVPGGKGRPGWPAGDPQRLCRSALDRSSGSGMVRGSSVPSK
jgi:DSBA-like thioredoxin domain